MCKPSRRCVHPAFFMLRCQCGCDCSRAQHRHLGSPACPVAGVSHAGSAATSALATLATSSWQCRCTTPWCSCERARRGAAMVPGGSILRGDYRPLQGGRAREHATRRLAWSHERSRQHALVHGCWLGSANCRAWASQPVWQTQVASMLTCPHPPAHAPANPAQPVLPPPPLQHALQAAALHLLALLQVPHGRRRGGALPPPPAAAEPGEAGRGAKPGGGDQRSRQEDGWAGQGPLAGQARCQTRALRSQPAAPALVARCDRAASSLCSCECCAAVNGGGLGREASHPLGMPPGATECPLLFWFRPPCSLQAGR